MIQYPMFSRMSNYTAATTSIFSLGNDHVLWYCCLG